MGITPIASYQLKSSVQGTTALVTPSFTPSNGEVITITMESFDTTITMTATNSGSQTVKTPVTEQPGGFNGFARISTIEVTGSPGSMTVTGTPSASARYSMTVERWGGAQLTATPVTNANTSTTGAAQSTITPSAGTSIIVWVGQDSQSVDPSTRTYAGSGTDDGTRDDHLGSNGVGYHGYQNSTGTGSQTYGLSTPTGQKWVICGIEVQAAAIATAPAPTFAVRRRLQVPRGRRLAGSAIKTQVVTAPALPPQVVRQPSRLRGLLPRRGRTFAVIPAQVIVQPPNYVPAVARVRARLLRLSRGRVAAVPAGQSRAPAPAGRPRLKLPKFFRGSTTAVPAAQTIAAAPAYVPPVVRARARILRSSRGRSANIVPLQTVAPVAPVYVPPVVRVRVRLLRWFRSSATQTPIAQQVAPQAPAYVPPGVRTRVRFARLSRARITTVAPGQPYVPPFARIRNRLVRLVRGRTTAVIPPQVTAVAPAYVPTSLKSRARALTTHRTRGAQVIPPQVVPAAPPPYVAPFTRALRRGVKLLRPHIFQVPANGQAAPPPPPPPPPAVIPPNGWQGLLGIIRSAREDVRIQQDRRAVSCPNDGEPLRLSADGYLFCQYDGWAPENQVIGVRSLGGEWGGLRAIIRDVEIQTRQDRIRRVVACPHDGEPLLTAQDGTIYCPFDGFILRP